MDLTPVPLPTLTSPGIVATAITARFLDACKALPPGSLVKDGHFTLFSAVAALEIMDPKMDSGYQAPGEPVEETYDVNRTLLPEEILGIIDQLLCHEMAWHLGYPLSQTIFTSVYVDSLTKTPVTPESLRQRDPNQDPLLVALWAYCLALVKTCYWVNEIVRSEAYFEEDDFVTNTYRRYMLENIDNALILTILTEARDMLRQMGPSVDVEVLLAIEFRLEIRYSFLRSIDASRGQSSPDISRTPWIHMRGFLQHIGRSHALGKPVPDSFSEKLQRHLASTVPPRPIVELSFKDAHRHFEQMVEDSIEALNLLDFKDTQSQLNFIQLFMSKSPTPLVYGRALMQKYLFRDDALPENWNESHLLDQDLSIIVLPSSPLLDRSNDDIEAVHDVRHFVAQQMQAFRQKAWFPFSELRRTWCQNRPRARRMLTHLLREWDVVQQEVEEIDAILIDRLGEESMAIGSAEEAATGFALPLSSWAHYNKLRVMEWICQLGFELEIYQADELAGMYHFLALLARMRSSHVERIKLFVPQPAMRKKGWFNIESLEAGVTWEMADALSSFYTVLLRLGLVKIPPRPYGSDELRYELRMRPWTGLSFPSIPLFEEFVEESTRVGKSTLEVLESAEKAVAHARKGLEVLGRIKPVDRFDHGCEKRWEGWYVDLKKAGVLLGVGVAGVKGAYARALEQKRKEKETEGADVVAKEGSEGGSPGKKKKQQKKKKKGKEVAGQRDSGDLKQDGASSSPLPKVGAGDDEKVMEPTPEELGIEVEIPAMDTVYHAWWIVPKVVPVSRGVKK